MDWKPHTNSGGTAHACEGSEAVAARVEPEVDVDPEKLHIMNLTDILFADTGVLTAAVKDVVVEEHATGSRGECVRNTEMNTTETVTPEEFHMGHSEDVDPELLHIMRLKDFLFAHTDNPMPAVDERVVEGSVTHSRAEDVRKTPVATLPEMSPQKHAAAPLVQGPPDVTYGRISSATSALAEQRTMLLVKGGVQQLPGVQRAAAVFKIPGPAPHLIDKPGPSTPQQLRPTQYPNETKDKGRRGTCSRPIGAMNSLPVPRPRLVHINGHVRQHPYPHQAPPDRTRPQQPTRLLTPRALIRPYASRGPYHVVLPQVPATQLSEEPGPSTPQSVRLTQSGNETKCIDVRRGDHGAAGSGDCFAGPVGLPMNVEHEENEPFFDNSQNSRAAHNEKERLRRTRMANSCSWLRVLVPGLSETTDQAAVFERAAEYTLHMNNFFSATFGREENDAIIQEFLDTFLPYGNPD